MYYENFKKLCESKGVKPTDVSKATGIATAILSNWKNGNYVPKQEKLQLVADYFNVSIDYLITGKENEFTVEMAKTDVELSNMDSYLKTYALKLAGLSKEKQEQIMSLIDMLEDKKGE